VSYEIWNDNLFRTICDELKFAGPHAEHSVATSKLETISEFAWRRDETKKTCVFVTGNLPDVAFYPAVRQTKYGNPHRFHDRRFVAILIIWIAFQYSSLIIWIVHCLYFVWFNYRLSLAAASALRIYVVYIYTEAGPTGSEEPIVAR